jgi:hypothetical protein
MSDNTPTNQPLTLKFIGRVVIKALVLFVILNGLFALFNPLSFIGEHLTLYHTLVKPRLRLPYGENPASYNLSLDNLDAMFASHALASNPDSDEFRLLVIGDSGVWGLLLRPEETLTEQLNALNLTTPDGRRIVAYNVAHPILSATKDLMLLDYAMRYQPDGVLWLVTLDALYQPDQLRPPLAQNNASRIVDLIETYHLNLDQTPLSPEPTFLERTIVGQRRPLSDWLRLQMFGLMWQNTGIDQVYEPYTPTANDLTDSPTWQGLHEGDDLAQALALDVIDAGYQRAGEAGIPLWVVNEPIMIADGANHDIRYNAWYPRWAYDEYRAILSERADANGWAYVDLWDGVPNDQFTDSPVHLSPEGIGQIAKTLAQVLSDRLQ